MAQMVRASSMLNFLKSEVINIENMKDKYLFDFNKGNWSQEGKNIHFAMLKGELDMIRKLAERYKLFDNDEFKLIFISVESNIIEH